MVDGEVVPGDVEVADGRVAATGRVPELPGGRDLMRLLVDRGVVVSVGHTDADADHARTAFAVGARAVNALCNALRPLHHPARGVVGVAPTTDAVTVELIVDGHHVDDDMVRVIWRAAAGRIALVSDGTAAAGMPDGTYPLGGTTVTVVGGVVRGTGGVLAGGELMLVDAVRNLHALGVPLPAALDAASGVPARLVGRADLGTRRPGAVADVVVVDEALTVRETFVPGHPGTCLTCCSSRPPARRPLGSDAPLTSRGVSPISMTTQGPTNNTLGITDVRPAGGRNGVGGSTAKSARKAEAMQSARQDIRTVESWGYSYAEALELVTCCAVAEARRVADEARVAPDRAALERTLRYLGELKEICQSLTVARRS